MHDILDLDRFPLDRLGTPAGQALVNDCRVSLEATGMFNLEDLVRPEPLAACVDALKPVIATSSFTHKRQHNIYFKRTIEGLPEDHPALRLCETVNHTICADQMADSLVCRIYEWPPLRAFLATTMQKPELHLMADPLARANVMSYRAGEALNWHFDRSEFTTTLLLQAPDDGGVFQYRTGLRSDRDPNYDGVARLLEGQDPDVRDLMLSPGTLNVFRGKNTAHRVTPVGGSRDRIIAVFSYYERSGVVFTDEERIGFYGRAA